MREHLKLYFDFKFDKSIIWIGILPLCLQNLLTELKNCQLIVSNSS